MEKEKCILHLEMEKVKTGYNGKITMEVSKIAKKK